LSLLYQLTDREQEILELIATGQYNQEIATELDISVFTVQSHIQSILRKVEAKNRVEAVSKLWQKRIEKVISVENS